MVLRLRRAHVGGGSRRLSSSRNSGRRSRLASVNKDNGAGDDNPGDDDGNRRAQLECFIFRHASILPLLTSLEQIADFFEQALLRSLFWRLRRAPKTRKKFVYRKHHKEINSNRDDNKG